MTEREDCKVIEVARMQAVAVAFYRQLFDLCVP